MKKLLFTFIFIAFCFYIHAQKILFVSTPEEMVTSIQSDCIIKFPDSCITVSDLKPVKTKYIEVVEQPDGNSYIILKGISDLTLAGKGYFDSYITSSTTDHAVLQFDSCRNITIDKLMFAHGPNKGETCDGAALLFTRCENIIIDSCYMFGSGSSGIYTTQYADNKFGVKNMKCTNSIISSCTEWTVNLEAAFDVAFENCNFIDNRGETFIVNSNNISFINCSFSFNHYMPSQPSTKDGLYISYLFYLDNSEKVSFTGCRISNNYFGYLVNDHNKTNGLLVSEFSNNNFRHGISYVE